MKSKIVALVLGVLIAIPYFLRAEVVEIPLQTILEMQIPSGNSPLDDAEHMGNVPPHPTDFRATINGRALSITKQEASISSAQAVVVNATTGSVVVNEVFTESMEEQIPDAGVYVLNIVTAGGALTGQFMVQ